MNNISSSIPRSSTLMASRMNLGHIGRTNLDLYKLQGSIATGLALQKPSDDAVRATTISLLDDRIERSTQHMRNLDHAESTLNVIDGAIGEVHDLILSSKDIALEQLNFGTSAGERENEAIVIDSMIDSLFNTANRESVGGFLFGGTITGQAPVESFYGGYRFRGTEGTLKTDLDLASSVPVTLGASNSIGALSARSKGFVDLDPPLTTDTRIEDVYGARGLGVQLGTLRFSVGDGPVAEVDLANADTVGDIVDALNLAFENYDEDNSMDTLGPGGVSVSGGSISFDILNTPDNIVKFYDVTGGTTGADLGLVTEPDTDFSTSVSRGDDINPKLTWNSPLQFDDPLGQVRLKNIGRSVVVDLSTAETVQDVRNMIEGAGLGLRVEINADATGIDVFNEVSAGRNEAMAIEEVGGNTMTATRLGIRTMSEQTRIDDFNHGKGVGIVTNQVDPVTGLPSEDVNVDFAITLGDGTTFDVNFRPEDMTTVGTVIARINAQAQSQGVGVPTRFVAELSDDTNGIVLRQDPSLGTELGIEPQNGSFAARDLGLVGGIYNATTGEHRAEDRATVRVDNLFSALIDLRDSLRQNDTFGISLAGEDLESHVGRAVETRALVGGYAQRLVDAKQREEQRMLIDETARSEIRDLDYAEAAVRFSTLQTQLQAGIQATTALQQLSILNYL